MDPTSLSDAELLQGLRAAQEEIPQLSDPEKRRAAWQRVLDATRELERRYPPEGDPIS